MRFGNVKVSIKALLHKNYLDTEMRVTINSAKLLQYAEEKKEGATFPEPTVFFDTKEEQYWIGDGFHRVLADNENGETECLVNLIAGSKLDAILHCIKSNRDQKGLPFTRGDKKIAIKTLLEYQVTKVWTQLRIAQMVGCSSQYVYHVIKELNISRPEFVQTKSGVTRPSKFNCKRTEDLRERRQNVKERLIQGKNHREIAEETGVSLYTVKNDVSALRSQNKIAACPRCQGTGFIQII